MALLRRSSSSELPAAEILSHVDTPVSSHLSVAPSHVSHHQFDPRETAISPRFPQDVQVILGDASQGDFSSRLITVKDLVKGQVVADLALHSWKTDKKRYTTVQGGPQLHYELGSEMVFTNHSCNPNVQFDMEKMQVIALKNIKAGQELTFFYPSTEWEMDQPFECWCTKDTPGELPCVGWIQGAKHLDHQVLNRYKLSGHIAAMKAQQ